MPESRHQLLPPQTVQNGGVGARPWMLAKMLAKTWLSVLSGISGHVTWAWWPGCTLLFRH